MLQQQGLSTSHVLTKYEREPYGVYEEGIVVKLLMALTICTCT
ncbi:MAG: hypothetical protein AB8G05_09270 [Oligoflexales bacterium]